MICRESNLRSSGICRENNLCTFGTHAANKFTHFIRKAFARKILPTLKVRSDPRPFSRKFIIFPPQNYREKNATTFFGSEMTPSEVFREFIQNGPRNRP